LSTQGRSIAAAVIAAGDERGTFALITSQPIAGIDPAHRDTGRGMLVAVLLSRTAYLKHNWDAEPLFDPACHPVRLAQ
jgi:hypothetical protein